jgi:hypothetical protein
LVLAQALGLATAAHIGNAAARRSVVFMQFMASLTELVDGWLRRGVTTEDRSYPVSDHLLQTLTRTKWETAGLKLRVFESQKNVHAPSSSEHCRGY